MAIVLIFLGLYFIIIASIIAGIVLLVVGLASKEKKNGCIIAGCIIFGCAFIFGIILFFFSIFSAAAMFAWALPNQL